MFTEHSAHDCGLESIIWDYQRGEVICVKCGAVLEERFTVNSSPRAHDVLETLRKNSVYTNKYYNIIKDKKVKYKKFKKLLKLMKKTNKGKRLKSKLEINVSSFEEYVKTGKAVLIFRRAPEGLEEILNDPIVKTIIEKKIKKDPRLNSRTLRSKVAVALILKEVYFGKRKLSLKDMREIAEKTGTSVSHVKRLYYFIRSR